jgi:hypothetical protein
MTMYRFMCVLLMISVVIGCKKHSHKPDRKTLEELLTGGQWLLTGYGYDDDHSGTLDADENLIMPCQKDNTTEYRRNGSGISLENQDVCMADPVAEFEWKLIDNEKAIEISAQRLDIHTLTEDELHFVIQVPGVTPALHIMYRK